MNLRILHDHLVRKIHQFGADAREHRQVYRRLSQLLPDRWKTLVTQHRARGLGPSDSARAAFVSDEFTGHIDEIVAFGASTLEARIQYETHIMLIDARRTIRASKQR